MGQLIEHRHKLSYDGANIPKEQSRHNKTLINEFRQATRANFSD